MSIALFILNFTIQAKLSLNVESSCLSLLGAGNMVVHTMLSLKSYLVSLFIYMLLGIECKTLPKFPSPELYHFLSHILFFNNTALAGLKLAV